MVAIARRAGGGDAVRRAMLPMPGRNASRASTPMLLSGREAAG